jgi:hypothetical protein
MSADFVSPCRSITASYRTLRNRVRNARHSVRVSWDSGDLVQRLSSHGIASATPSQRATSGAKPFSTTQSIRASARLARMSCTAGIACTTSPSEESLTIRILTGRF